MRQTKIIVMIFSFLLTSTSMKGQNGADFYTANITGASSIILNKVDYNSFDYGINHRFIYGTIYPDNSGVIHLNLPRGQYEYIAEQDGMRSKHGTFYISGRDIYFEVHLSPTELNTEDNGIRSSRQLVKDGNSFIDKKEYKKARELFYQAAIDGNADGMYNYAFMLKNGVGGRTDKEQAFFWLKEALTHGHYAAEQRLQYFNEKWRWGVASGYGKASKFIQ